MACRPKTHCQIWMLLALFIGVAQANETAAPSHPGLREELVELKRIDQGARTSDTFSGSEMREMDIRNTARLKDIIAKHGWPTKSMVGEDGASAAWLLAQHADQDPDFQLSVLRLMRELLPSGEAKASEYAYLYDRTHRPQRYGTQGGCVGPGTWLPRDIEKPQSVDEERAAMKIQPPKLAAYLEMMNRQCK